jgi:hypothetical protein
MKTVAIALLLSAGVASAAAGPVIDGGAPDLTGVYFADYYAVGSGGAGTLMDLSSSVTFDTFQWWGGYFSARVGVTGSSSSLDVFALSIFAANGLTFGNQVASAMLGDGQAQITGRLLPSGAPIGWVTPALEYQFSSTFAPITLASGNYFFNLVRLPSASNTGVGSPIFGWENSAGGAQSAGAPLGLTNLAFQAQQSTPVPEVSTLLMVLLGLASAGLLALRRRDA